MDRSYWRRHRGKISQYLLFESISSYQELEAKNKADGFLGEFFFENRSLRVVTLIEGFRRVVSEQLNLDINNVQN